MRWFVHACGLRACAQLLITSSTDNTAALHTDSLEEAGAPPIVLGAWLGVRWPIGRRASP